MTHPLFRSTALTLSFLGLATPALAQDNLCGGSGANGIWIGGDEAASDITVADNFQEQMALILGGNDYVSLFTLSEGTEVRVEAAGRGAGDPIIDLLNSDGSVILFADNPNFRGYWYGTNKLFLNALFFSRLFDAPDED